jgi:hypothetical protein
MRRGKGPAGDGPINPAGAEQWRNQAMALEKEQATFARELQRLLAEDVGKYALVHGDEVAGTYDTYQDAIQEGYEKFGLEPFLVKRIAVTEQAQFITRDLIPCPS